MIAMPIWPQVVIALRPRRAGDRCVGRAGIFAAAGMGGRGGEDERQDEGGSHDQSSLIGRRD